MISYNLLTKNISFMKVALHERHGVSNYRLLDCLLKSLFRLRLKIKQSITDPFWGESTSYWWFPWIPLTMRKAFRYHDVIVFRFICILWLWHRRCKSFHLELSHHHDNKCCNLHGKCWFIEPCFLNHKYNLKWYFLSLMTWITNLNYTHPGLNIGPSWWSKVLKVKNILVACSIWGPQQTLTPP